jgi:hypothetical protein
MILTTHRITIRFANNMVLHGIGYDDTSRLMGHRGSGNYQGKS